MKRRKKWTLRRVLSLGLAVLMIVGAVAGIAALTKSLTADQKTISPTFQRGEIDVKTGEQKESNSSLYSDPFDAKGLTIELDFDAKLSYRVFWYEKETGNFNYCTESLTQGAKLYAPAECEARIVLTPLWDKLEDDDNEISWYEVWSYSSKITILVDKDQDVLSKEYAKYKLTDNRIFTVTAGAYDPGYKDQGGFNTTDDWAARCTTYSFKNRNSMVSSMYLDLEEGVDVQECRIVLITWDNVVHEYYSGGGYQPNTDVLPTADRPLFVANDTEVYIYFNGEVDVNDVRVFLY